MTTQQAERYTATAGSSDSYGADPTANLASPTRPRFDSGLLDRVEDRVTVDRGLSRDYVQRSGE